MKNRGSREQRSPNARVGKGTATPNIIHPEFPLLFSVGLPTHLHHTIQGHSFSVLIYIAASSIASFLHLNLEKRSNWSKWK